MFIDKLYIGIVAGLFAAIVVGFLRKQYQGWVRDRNAFRSPMSIVLKTEKTPADIAKAASRAERAMRLLQVAILAVAVAVFEYLYPGSVREAVELLATMLIRLYEIMQSNR